MSEFLKDLESEQTAATADLNAHDASAMISPGNGGRGLMRRTKQPGINCVNINLDYEGNRLLEQADVKFFPGRVYALIGRNGVGKSTVLKNIKSRNILGIASDTDAFLLYQEVLPCAETVREFVIKNDDRLAILEDMLDDAVDDEVEEICNEIAEVESLISDERNLIGALSRFGVELFIDTPMSELSGGERKRVGLSIAALINPSILLLDEPTNHLDIKGIGQLISFINSVNSTTAVVIVSHNRDLIDEVCSDVTEMKNKKLKYFRGSYNDFLKQSAQADLTQTRQANAVNRERQRLLNSMGKMKLQAGKEGGAGGKRKKQIESRKKKLERTGIEKDEHGHRYSAQTQGSGRVGSINMTLNASARHRWTFRSMLQAVSGVLHPYIDKEIHFKFVPTPVYEFHEPLLKVEDVDFKFEGAVNAFLHAEMCVAQRSRNIIVGENGSGKSTMMSLLGGALDPTEGAVKRVQNLNVGYFSQMVADELLQDVKDYDTPLSWMGRIHPEVTEFDMRGELSAFGIGGSKVGTTIRMMSGGERTRIILTSLMVKRPHILILDEPSNHLDLDSVHALGVGLGEWNGTIILATHDSNLVRLVMEHSPQEYEKNFYQLVSVDKKWGLGYERAVKRLEPSEFEKYWTE